MRLFGFELRRGVVVFVFLLFFCMPFALHAQINDTVQISRHKIEIYWDRLMPSYWKLQYAGSMGFVSLGLGWEYGKHRQWETDVLFGYIPRRGSIESHQTFTLKENYIPWRCCVFSGKMRLEPLETGIYASRIFGDEFWYKSPNRYPTGYYSLATNLRFNIFLGQRIRFSIDRKKVRLVTFFYEVSTNDLYLIDKFTNRCVEIRDIISLSFGLKYNFP